jgi:hypothetical protein
MTTELSESDEGKDVVSSDDQNVGVVKEVDGGTIHVDPDPGITDELKSKLGWSDSGGETYPVSQDDIATVTDGEVRLGHGS